MSERRRARLVSQRLLSPSVKLLRFRLVDEQPLRHRPGQWLNVGLAGQAAELRRAYSLASAAGADGANFELAVTMVEQGALSPHLHHLVIGDEIEVDGPHGFFTRDDPTSPSLFVGTGSGLAPLRAMLQAALGEADGGSCEGESVPLTLLFGCRTRQDLLFADEIRRWELRHAEFRAFVSYSRVSEEELSGPRELCGHVQDHLALVLAERPVEHVYICGLSGMVKAVREALKPLGYGRGRVHAERYD